jgi:hypothetical protein
VHHQHRLLIDVLDRNRNRKARESRLNRNHAKACRPRKRPPKRPIDLGRQKPLDQYGDSKSQYSGQSVMEVFSIRARVPSQFLDDRRRECFARLTKDGP